LKKSAGSLLDWCMKRAVTMQEKNSEGKENAAKKKSKEIISGRHESPKRGRKTKELPKEAQKTPDGEKGVTGVPRGSKAEVRRGFGGEPGEA